MFRRAPGRGFRHPWTNKPKKLKRRWGRHFHTMLETLTSFLAMDTEILCGREEVVFLRSDISDYYWQLAGKLYYKIVCCECRALGGLILPRRSIGRRDGERNNYRGRKTVCLGAREESPVSNVCDQGLRSGDG